MMRGEKWGLGALRDRLRGLLRPGPRAGRTYRQLKDIAAGDRPILCGPFFTEIGFEVLYWIPFVNWFRQEFGIAPGRLVVVSRGGAQSWYRHVTADYEDVFDYFTLDEFKRRNEERIAENKRNGQGNAPKHLTVSFLDREIIKKVVRKRGFSDFNLLHPSHMFRFMGAMRNSPDMEFTRYELFRADDRTPLPEGLPDDYVAVKFWFGGQFPDTETNRRFIRNLVNALARSGPVVLLNSGLGVERTPAFDAWFDGQEFDGGNVHGLRGRVPLRQNLDVQTAVIRRSRLFVGTYGGFAYAAPFAGVPAVTFYSNEGGFVYEHLDMLQRALRRLRLETGRPADFAPWDVRLFSHCAGRVFDADFLRDSPVVGRI